MTKLSTQMTPTPPKSLAKNKEFIDAKIVVPQKGGAVGGGGGPI